MLDSTEIKGAVRLKISHWPIFFLIFFFPNFFDVTVDHWDRIFLHSYRRPLGLGIKKE
jgi:hypothetical protein